MKYFIKETKFFICIDIKENRVSGHNTLHDRGISSNYKFFYSLKEALMCNDNKYRPSYFTKPIIIPYEI